MLGSETCTKKLSSTIASRWHGTRRWRMSSIHWYSQTSWHMNSTVSGNQTWSPSPQYRHVWQSSWRCKPHSTKQTTKQSRTYKLQPKRETKWRLFRRGALLRPNNHLMTKKSRNKQSNNRTILAQSFTAISALIHRIYLIFAMSSNTKSNKCSVNRPYGKVWCRRESSKTWSTS